MMVDVAVIGGGISGLAVAHDMQCRGHQVMVLERQATAGGNAVSERGPGRSRFDDRLLRSISGCRRLARGRILGAAL